MEHTSPGQEIIVQDKVSGGDPSLRKSPQLLLQTKHFRYGCRLEPSELFHTFFEEITLAG